MRGQVAQLVEHLTENQGVGGSIPSLAINQCNKLRAADWLPVSTLRAYSAPTSNIAAAQNILEGNTIPRKNLFVELYLSRTND
jgi:hypothetical protein